jgi:hypothetical protein
VPPNLITNVATTDATVPDSQMIEKIHQKLAARGLLSDEHYLDSGYPSVELLVSARKKFGIALITPVLLDHSAQTRAATGYDRAAFTIDWDFRAGQVPARTGEFLVEPVHPARHRGDRGQVQRRGLPAVSGSLLVHLGKERRTPAHHLRPRSSRG